MALAAVSSEVVAYAAEPPEAAVLVSSLCMVVAPKNVHSTCHVAVKETITEHYLSPGVTTVEPPEVAASAAEPPEVSVVPSCESLLCPVTAMEAVCDSLSCAVTAMEAVCESLSCLVTAMEAICESLSCPVTAMEAVCEPLSCPVTATEVAFEHMLCSEPANVSDSELPVSVKEYTPELSTMNSETVNAPPVLSVSALSVLSVSVRPRSQTLPWFPARSAFLRWSSASVWWSTAQVWWSSAPPWWSSARVWWSSAPPWWSSARVWWAPVPSAPPWWAPVPSAPPWWAPVPSTPPWWAPVPSAPPWWAPVPSSLPWLPALPQSPVSPFAHGPGPPSLPLFHLHSTSLLDRIGASGSRSLGGALSRCLFPTTHVNKALQMDPHDSRVVTVRLMAQTLFQEN